jgi:hypothetical protein
MSKCAPGKSYIDGSCFTIENLVDIAKAYNKAHPNNSFQINKDKKYLLKNLTSRLEKDYNCNHELCWLDTSLIKNLNNNEIEYYTFRPEGPDSKYEWLSTTDINNVMYQYEEKYPNFKFFGAVPYDFEDLPQLDTYQVNFKKLLNNNISQIGTVINLDTHDKSGSHWVGLYSNLLDKKIYFFDSFAKKPGKRIQKFIGKILTFTFNKDNNTNLAYEQITNQSGLDILSDNNYDVRYNKKQHQFKNSECGVYSMNFIIRLLNGETFDNIIGNITKDEAMNECRQVYFRN